MKIDEYHALVTKPKQRKYRNIPIEIDGLRFDSKREGYRWIQLRQLERAGEIAKLQRQVVFPLVVNGELICKFHADFVYCKDGKRIIEDSKGYRTREFVIKKKLMRALLGIDVFET